MTSRYNVMHKIDGKCKQQCHRQAQTTTGCQREVLDLVIGSGDELEAQQGCTLHEGLLIWRSSLTCTTHSSHMAGDIMPRSHAQ